MPVPPWVDLAPSTMSTVHLRSHESLSTRFFSFDLDLPVDCDDEYWYDPDPEKCFKQPPNKPSSVTAFILYIKLHQILAFSLRTIVSRSLQQSGPADSNLVLKFHNSIQSTSQSFCLVPQDNHGSNTLLQSWTQRWINGWVPRQTIVRLILLLPYLLLTSIP